MKVGDMVNYIPYADKNYGLGVITSIDDFNHRQTVMYVLFSTGGDRSDLEKASRGNQCS